MRIETLISRLKRIGIEITLQGNYHWIYLDTINGNKVKERFASEHGFVIGFLNKDFAFTYSKETFKLIRKYVK